MRRGMSEASNAAPLSRDRYCDGRERATIAAMEKVRSWWLEICLVLASLALIVQLLPGAEAVAGVAAGGTTHVGKEGTGPRAATSRRTPRVTR
jgi:hypothetical protein